MAALSLGVAFAAGMISITSPCCLPLLPGYLGYLAGVSQPGTLGARRRPLYAALLFAVGFTFVFIALGATASVLGALLQSYRLPLARAAGLFILVMGALLVLDGRLGLLSRSADWRHGLPGGRLWTAAPLGAAFALTWTPCIGPVLGAILALAGSTADLRQGVLLLTAYSAGLALPFVALGLSVVKFRSWVGRRGLASALVHGVAGVVLVAMGTLLVTERWLPLISPVLAWYAQAKWPPL